MAMSGAPWGHSQKTGIANGDAVITTRTEMKTIELTKLQQGDLLRVRLTDYSGHPGRKAPGIGQGWLLVNEVGVDGRVINANFMPKGSNGFGNVLWPKFVVYVLIRGRHGECSPFAALSTLLGRPTAESCRECLYI